MLRQPGSAPLPDRLSLSIGQHCPSTPLTGRMDCSSTRVLLLLIEQLSTFMNVLGILCVAARRVIATVQAIRLRPMPVHKPERHPVRIDIPALLCTEVTDAQLERAVAFPQRAQPRPAVSEPVPVNLTPEPLLDRKLPCTRLSWGSLWHESIIPYPLKREKGLLSKTRNAGALTASDHRRRVPGMRTTAHAGDTGKAHSPAGNLLAFRTSPASGKDCTVLCRPVKD